MKKGTTLLLSGGVDSVVALYHCLAIYENIECISFNYGSKHNHKEIPFAAYHCEQLKLKHHIVDLSFFDKMYNSSLLSSGEEIPDGHYAADNMKSTVVPFRNGIMLSIAAGLSESKEYESVTIAAHSGDHAIYPDCRPDFMDKMSVAIHSGTYNDISIHAPFVDIDKTEIVKIGLQLGVDFAQTWSCYKGQDVHCGSCGTCVERKEAFQLNAAEDPTIYLA